VWAKRSESAERLAAMLKVAMSEPGVPATTDQFDADPFAFNVANGTIDLRAGELRAHRREDLITKLAPVTYDPQASAPIWAAFLERISGGDAEIVDYLWRLFGMCLTGDIRTQELFIFWGGGANGKNVLLDTVCSVLGDYAAPAPPELLTSKTGHDHPTEVADLCGRRFVVASETEENAHLRVALMKRLTGDARLKARFMRQDYFEFPRTHKLVLVTNSRPVIRETTNAVWRRIRLVPFTVTIPEQEQDLQLLEKLCAERAGILAWLVAGCLEWQARGLQPPAAVTDATSAYAKDQDPLSDYLAARVRAGDARQRITRNDLYSDYLSWCSQTREPQPVARDVLLDRVRRLPGVTEGQWRPVGLAVPARGFQGVGLAPANGPAEGDFGEDHNG
jgi:putative DNA primase/helicase